MVMPAEYLELHGIRAHPPFHCSPQADFSSRRHTGDRPVHFVAMSECAPVVHCSIEPTTLLRHVAYHDEGLGLTSYRYIRLQILSSNIR